MSKNQKCVILSGGRTCLPVGIGVRLYKNKKTRCVNGKHTRCVNVKGKIFSFVGKNRVVVRLGISYNYVYMYVSVDKLEKLRAAIGMSGLIDAVERGETPSDLFKGATTADGLVVTRRLRHAIRTYGSYEVLDQCIKAFKSE